MAELRWGYWVRPIPGETVSGDAVITRTLDDNEVLLAIVDGLGHGREAHKVVVLARTYLLEHAGSDLVGNMLGLHQALAGTRGAAVGLALVAQNTGMLQYMGLGNTIIRRIGSKEQRLVSRDGVVGQTRRTLLAHRMVLEGGDLVLMYTDGVQSHFSANELRGVRTVSPTRLARRVIEQFGKTSDDAGCIAMRYVA